MQVYHYLLIQPPYPLRCMPEIPLRPDTRIFSDAEEDEIECRECGVRLKVLLCDVREGLCFDCAEHWNNGKGNARARRREVASKRLEEFG